MKVLICGDIVGRSGRDVIKIKLPQLIKEKESIWGNKLHSFSIGLKGAPDLKYAKIVADFLGTTHHEYNFTVQEGLDAISELVWHLETYDVTTIRASTPMYLMSRLIKSSTSSIDTNSFKSKTSLDLSPLATN